MTRARRLAPIVLLALLAGCASGARIAQLPPVPAPSPKFPAELPPAPRAAVRDSQPSREAQAVLATIPEPLPADARVASPVPPPAPSHAAPPSPRPAVPEPALPLRDSVIVPSRGISAPVPPPAPDTAAVPVPAPTSLLGDRAPAMPETPPPANAPASNPATAPVVPASVAAAPDTCWRVQIGAPADRLKGKQLRDGAESLLLVPMIVDREAGRFKVRTRDCLARTAAESLRDRAVASGFKGVFLVRLVEAPK